MPSYWNEKLKKSISKPKTKTKVGTILNYTLVWGIGRVEESKELNPFAKCFNLGGNQLNQKCATKVSFEHSEKRSSQGTTRELALIENSVIVSFQDSNGDSNVISNGDNPCFLSNLEKASLLFTPRISSIRVELNPNAKTFMDHSGTTISLSGDLNRNDSYLSENLVLDCTPIVLNFATPVYETLRANNFETLSCGWGTAGSTTSLNPNYIEIASKATFLNSLKFVPR